MSNLLNTILAVDKEQELLQSFIRTGAAAEEESQEETELGLVMARGLVG